VGLVAKLQAQVLFEKLRLVLVQVLQQLSGMTVWLDR
jgi:hypothetical protein